MPLISWFIACICSGFKVRRGEERSILEHPSFFLHNLGTRLIEKPHLPSSILLLSFSALFSPLPAPPCSSASFLFSLLFSLSHIKQALAALIHHPLSPSFFLLLSYFLFFLICTPKGVVCLLTSWSKDSAGLRLAPIIRAWQGAAVSTCQTNKHPFWHPPGCVWRGVSQPPSSGPLISVWAHSAYTSTHLLCSGQAAIVLLCTATLMTQGFTFSLRHGYKEKGRIKKVCNMGGSTLWPFQTFTKDFL